MTSKKYVSFGVYLKKEGYLLALQEKGVQIVLKRKKTMLGIAFIVLGVVTIPIPLTTIPLIMVGCSFMRVSKYRLMSESGRKFRVFRNNLQRRIN